MKSKSVESLPWIALLVLAGMAAEIVGSEKTSIMVDRGEPFRDAKVHTDLQPIYEDSSQIDPISLLGQDPEILAIAALSQESIFDRSEALNHQGNTTLVPKGAVLFVPDHASDRLGIDFDSQIVAWNEFYQKNSHWVMAFGVRLEQALGEEPIDESLLERLGKSGKVIVATYFEHPISIRETPAEGGEETSAEES